ncbi:MAG: ABC transporter permease [Anaerolineae bacterium]|nr:ABC transporter permease [Anaerolineae bacterium]
MRSNAATTSERASWGLKSAALGAILFLHTPLLVVILYAFTTDRKTAAFPPPGLTLEWFGRILERQDFWYSLGLSLQVAVVATSIAIVLGTLCAAAMYRANFFGKEVISLFVLLPIALPGIVTGIALRSGMRILGIDFSFWTIVIGHATFCIVTVYNNVVARMRRGSYSQIEASMDLGATSFQTLRYIVLPNIGTALLAGAMLAFALSMDEVIVTTFTSDPKVSSTLPIWILSQLTRPRDRPVTNVASIVVILITLIPILVAYRYTQEQGET